MNQKSKAIIASVGAAAVLTMTPVGHAIAAWCSGDAMYVYGSMAQKFMPFLTGAIGKTGLSVEGAVAAAGAANRGEIAKATMVNKTVAEGLEAYRQEQELKLESLELAEALKQPPTTCQAVAVSDSLGAAEKRTQAGVFRGQVDVMKRVTGNDNTVALIESSHSNSNSRYCAPEEARLGICSTAGGSYGNLAGADQDALFLFQSKSGSSSYEGAVDANGTSAQSEAADSYIARVVGGLPPEQLRDKGEEYYKSNPQARAYVELSRRYNAMLSMGAYSLNQVKELHKAQKGLGSATMMATVKAPGFEPNKVDMSMAEVVERFVATKFSPESVQALATTTEPNLILRDLAQMQSFQLWMSVQAMQQSSRTEGIMAHQLALIADETLRPQIAAQRRAATAAATK